MHSDDFFLHIENHYTSNLPFVVYKKPQDTHVKGLFQKNDKLYRTQSFNDSGFVIVPFDSSIKNVMIPLTESESLSCELKYMILNYSSQNDIIANDTGKENHLNLVQKGIDFIQKGHSQKVVLSRCESIPFSHIQFISVFKRMLQNYPNAFVYCWYHPKVGLWLGATPETLISMSGNRMKTMALAGTQTYKGTTEVIWENKEKEEQQFVSDYMETNLKSSTTSLSVSGAKTVKAGNLLHLQSNISGILNTDLKSVLNTLHPTPAVCGLPVDVTKRFILKNESYSREFYTGFLGELNLNETTQRNTNRRNVENNAYGSVKTVSNLFVNLRCMQIKNNHALIYVGGGITKDSIPELEWKETVSKAETMKLVLLS